MKKIILILVAFGSFVNAQNYTFTNTTGNYSDLVSSTSINNGEVWDEESSFLVPLSHPFFINGVMVTSLTISDGMVFSNASSNDYQFLNPLGTDLIDQGTNTTTSQSPLSYKVDGTVGNRITKIEFKNIGSPYDTNFTMFINFQIWLYEITNIIEYRYGPSSITDSALFYSGQTGALIGIYSFNSDTFFPSNIFLLSGNVNSPLVSNDLPTYVTGTPAPNTVYRFTPTSTLSTNTFENSWATLYPNPVKEVLNFSTKENIETKSVEVFNMLGQLVLALPNPTNSINVSTLTKGNYLIKITTEKGIANSKFIKE